MKFNRIVLIVLDSLGIGEMPDAESWGDAGADTLGHILESRKVNLPNLQKLGLGNIRPLANLTPVENPIGNYGKCTLKSNGKDTTTGHWEIAGIVMEQAFPTFPQGFPQRIIDKFVAQTNVPGVLANVAARILQIVDCAGKRQKRGHFIHLFHPSFKLALFMVEIVFEKQIINPLIVIEGIEILLFEQCQPIGI
jgi:phosphopentomutase